MMRAFVLDRADRTVRIERVRREGTILYRGDGEYAMRGVSWAWGSPAYPRHIFAVSFVPFIGPAIANWLFKRTTLVFIAEGVPATLEPRSVTLDQSMTDEQAKAIMEAHAEAFSLGRPQLNPLVLLALGAMAVAALAIVALIR